ncbi:type I pantothenate kinase [Pullulanibacillus sp. KACC 23026]|uniref:type I pantothenate kinase n=1 Tax=Pullulanibacillus sp. KACC 23026 TaxID=3028315 RepID=UPI0023AEDEC7|nr:type I pantothenate kinase [Pullulanibacillus sp. KACC 23026]WEG12017.1 type I pantothenate kinase [Pullulanibacillus sp. KACC 23026]
MSIDSLYTRSEWQACFKNKLTFDGRLLNLKVPQAELESIYLPLITFILKWRQSSGLWEKNIRQSLNLRDDTQTPFLIGVAGSVAAGKSTTSHLIATLLSAQDPSLNVETLSTDHFLFPNAELQTRGMMNRKGFPESYDWDRLHHVLTQLKKGEECVHTPIYSHEVYDITGEIYEVKKPDVVILEGINVLQAGHGFRPISDWLDLKIYVDAEEDSVFNWYWERIQNLVATADQNPHSYFHQFKNMDQEALFAFAQRIWRDINAVNLHDYILPSRERADLILKKGPNHEIQSIKVQIN